MFGTEPQDTDWINIFRIRDETQTPTQWTLLEWKSYLRRLKLKSKILLKCI